MEKDIFESGLLEQLFQEINKKTKDPLDTTNQDSTFNIFKVLGIESKEVLMCRLLGDLLNPCGAHGLEEIPLTLFLKQLKLYDDFTPDKIRNASVILEEPTDEKRRIDIAIYIGNDIIPIEAKIWAEDQKKQLWDYYKQYFGDAKNKKIYYLTPTGHEPSEDSLFELEGTNQYKCLSFKEDISRWINKIEDNLSNDNERVKNILDQFKEVINNMCAQEENLKVIKDILENENSYLKAMLYILEVNQKNDLWKEIRKKYLLKNIEDQIAPKYKLIDPTDKSISHCIFEIQSESGEIVGSICVDTNLYIVTKNLKNGYEKIWKTMGDRYWRYFGIKGADEKFDLKDVNFEILENKPLGIKSLLDQIEIC